MLVDKRLHKVWFSRRIFHVLNELRQKKYRRYELLTAIFKILGPNYPQNDLREYTFIVVNQYIWKTKLHCSNTNKGTHAFKPQKLCSVNKQHLLQLQLHLSFLSSQQTFQSSIADYLGEKKQESLGHKPNRDTCRYNTENSCMCSYMVLANIPVCCRIVLLQMRENMKHKHEASTLMIL